MLVVDDKFDIAEVIDKGLRQKGFESSHAESAEDALKLLEGERFDIILMDIDMPGMSGLKLLKLLKGRADTAQIPVIMLTVLGSEAQKVNALGLGADDYLVKPFSVRELAARIEAVLRRVKPQEPGSEILAAGGLEVDFGRREVRAAGKKIQLTPTEFDLLRLLMKRPGFVLTFEALAEAINQSGREATSEAIYAHIKNIRRKLGPLGESIETVHGVGYKLRL
ncbi:MAG: response regulator transcription factor [Elusimicrobia bacterium]|nr:response regulator transcription factor [Elusimicrobiota bacterium]